MLLPYARGMLHSPIHDELTDGLLLRRHELQLQAETSGRGGGAAETDWRRVNNYYSVSL